MIILHPRWQYVYWFVVFVICGFFIRVCHAVFQGTPATTAAVFLTLCCVSTIAAYIDKKAMIYWRSLLDWDVKRLPSGQWQCLQCGETSIYFSNLVNLAGSHRREYTCGGRNDTETLTGCTDEVYQCHTDMAKHRTICQSCPQKHRMCLAPNGCSNNVDSNR